MGKAKVIGIIIGMLVLSISFNGLEARSKDSGESSVDDPYPPDSPWPCMRGDLQNTGRWRLDEWEPVRGAAREPVYFRTKNGIFSTPVIDGQDRIYVGSADWYFYLFDPHKKEQVWRFYGGEIIDSAAALSRDGRIYVPSGDARVHALDASGKEIWAFDVLNNRPPELYTFGTNYWFEGNVVIGPDGALYAGNDDFFMYCIEPDGILRWAFRTGMLIWSAPSFPDQESLYFAGFDMKLYKLDQQTGKLIWKTNLGNPLVSSPAIGADGTIYQGCMDGRLYAIEPERGKVKWSLTTGGHIYASPAISEDGLVYITSTDGFLYAVSSRDGNVFWTFYTGDAVRCSPVLGPDPEAKEPYLVYFGGGQGQVYAIDPHGARRWSYDTLFHAGSEDYPNINASPALGKSGLAVASANGDVIWIPYDYYLQKGAPGINRDPTDGFSSEGAAWYYVSPGGLIERKAMAKSVERAGILSIHPSQVISLRLISRQNGRTESSTIDPSSISVSLSPHLSYRVELQSDSRTIHIIPGEMPEPGIEYLLEARASYQNAKGNKGKVYGVMRLVSAEAKAVNPLMTGSLPAFEVTHMAIPQPAIVPSLDQIGIACQIIPFKVLEVDQSKKTFVAWAVQRSGETEEGEEAGVPDKRCLFYAFHGWVQDDFFMMEAKNSFFEESAFPFPLDLFRLSGRMLPDGSVDKHSSLFAEFEPQGIIKAIPVLTVSTEEQESGQENLFMNAVSGGGLRFFEAARATLPTLVGYISRKIWKPWGVYNHEGRLVGVGTFRMRSLPREKTAIPSGLEILRFEYLPRKNKVIAEIRLREKASAREPALGILLKDKSTGRPVAINYNMNTLRKKLEHGTKVAELSIPRSVKLSPGNTTAYLMLELCPLKKLEF